MITTNKKIVFSRIEFYLTCAIFASNTLAFNIVQNQQNQIAILENELARQSQATQQISETLQELLQKQRVEVSSESVPPVQHFFDTVNTFHLNPKYVLGLIGTLLVWYSGNVIYAKISKMTLSALLSKVSILGIPLFKSLNTLSFAINDFVFSIDIDDSNEVHQLRAKHIDDADSVDIADFVTRDFSKEQETALELVVPDTTTLTTTADAAKTIELALSGLGVLGGG